MPYRDMPEPLSLRKVLGPSVILAGLGVGSGEYIIWPFMTATVGTGFLWAAMLSVTVQYFLNMEIERYTLATGETAVSGFVRFWKPWGVIFCLFTILPNMWPGWATSGVTILTFLMGGGDVPLITIGILIASGIALTTSPVVYQTLERAQFFKVGLTLVFLAVAIVAAISPSAWADLPQAITNFGRLPDSNVIPISLILSGLVFAGAGGVNNLAQSNWIRDKGFGMGVYIPRIVSPITGEEAAAPATGSMVRQDPENIRRFHGWWAVANKEQLVSFWAICADVVRRALVWHVLLGLWGDVDDPGRTRHHRLHLAHRRRRVEDGVPAAEPAVDRKPDLFSRRVGHDRCRVDDPDVGFQPAAAPAGHCRLPERDGDVRLLDPAHPAESPRAAAGAARERVPAGDAAFLDRVLRLLRRLAGDRAGAGLPGGTLKL
jgi:hypothetical protein